MTLDDLIREYDNDGFGPNLAELVDRVVKATAPQYPALEYSDSSVWNTQSFEDARNDWLEKRLVGRGDLGKMLRQAKSLGQLRAALTTSFSQFLVNRRPRSSAANLYKRSNDMLRDKDEIFAKVGSSTRSGSQLWTLVSAPREERSQLDVDALVAVARQHSDEELAVIRYGEESLKSSPILRAPQLERFLTHLLEGAEGALDMATIAEVMRIRFELWEFEPVEFKGAFAAETPAVDLEVPTEAAARSVFLRLSPEAVRALIAVDEANGEFEAAAKSLGCSLSEVFDPVADTLSMVAAYAADPEEARAIYERLKELLLGG